MKKVLFSAIFLAFLLIGVHSLFAQEDVTPPVIKSLDFAPNSIDVSGGSQIITFTLRVTDDLSGLQSGYLSLSSPSTTQQHGYSFGYGEILSGTINDGIYQFDITIPQYAEAGPWRIGNLYMVDTVGNYIQLGTAELVALTFPTVVTVSGGPDLVPPIVASLNFAPNSIDVSGGSQTITFTLRVTDDLSGLQSGYLSLSSPSTTQQHGYSFGYGEILSGTINDGIYQFDITIPQYAEAGPWRIGNLYMVDTVGNYIQLGTAELVALNFPTMFTVLSNLSDTTPPSIQGLDFAPNSIDVSGGSQTITFTLRVTDDLSGLQSGYLSLSSPSTTQQHGYSFGYGEILSGTINDGIYQFDITIPQYAEAGPWRIGNLYMVDTVGNYIQLGTAELVALNFPTVVTVSENKNPIANAGPDKTALVKEQINFDGRQSSDSDGYVTAWVWDFGDGSPTATGTLPSHAYAQPGQYTVTLTVTDDKGATAVDQALVLVKAPITAVGDLVADVKNSTSGSIQKSLLSKLNRVLDSLNKKNDGAAINKLMLFIEEVQAQRAKKIPGDVADRLIALANRIIAAVQAGANTFQVSTIDALTRAESSNLSESPGHTVVETPGFAIRLRIEEPGALTVAITDSKGSLVGLVYGQFKKAGDNIVIWNGRDLQGNPCPKGAYSYQALGSFKPNTSGVIIIR